LIDAVLGLMVALLCAVIGLVFATLAVVEAVETHEVNTCVTRSAERIEVPIQSIEAAAWMFDGVWSTQVQYTYEFRQRKYQAAKLACVEPRFVLSETQLMTLWNTSHRSEKAAVRAMFTTCWVDPKTPADAILLKSSRSSSWSPVFLAGAVAVVLLLAALSSRVAPHGPGAQLRDRPTEQSTMTLLPAVGLLRRVR
jgi:hypothetical protein